MTYTLHRLAAGSCDLVLDGVIVGSVVREVSADGGHRAWHAELLDDLPPDQRPSPFIKIEHAFPALDAVTAWLGGAVVERGSNALIS
ncbi:hypothetical protein MKK70_05865 [Methylobacterium sp. E-041]|uniref:hypothetical protein n=1 Tax=Methylobacterium sp. E-041 TaxID=2836573 RepID=UPI001FB96C1D|nr:hypothetical protein [Methylobacterium sp. E-041]MCJ2104913.1 hypothetical protein [Methylobacterium sp. E-041]